MIQNDTYVALHNIQIDITSQISGAKMCIKRWSLPDDYRDSFCLTKLTSISLYYIYFAILFQFHLIASIAPYSFYSYSFYPSYYFYFILFCLLSIWYHVHNIQKDRKYKRKDKVR